MAKKRNRSGSYVFEDENGKLYARVQIRLPNGTYKTVKRRAKNRTHVIQLAQEIKAQYGERGEAYFEGESLRFNELADWYCEEFIIPPVYSEEGVKVAGMRTHRAETNKLKNIRSYFGTMLVKDITEHKLHEFKSFRYSQGVSVATVNRDLELLRAMFGRAFRRRWIKENPFDFGERLIEKSLEQRRQVTLSSEEETLLLKEARNSNSLLYYLLLMLRDTGARPSELYNVNGILGAPVLWKDVFDFDMKVCRLTSLKSRRKSSRFAPVTKRLRTALTELWVNTEDKNVENQIFPITTFKTSFGRIRKKVGLEHIRLRDLRRDFRTRLGKQGFSDQMAQRILGHSKADTTYIYAEADIEVAKMAADVLDRDSKPSV